MVDLIAECKEILTSMMKMIESKAVEVVEDPEAKIEVDDKPEVVVELVSLQEEVSPRPTKVVELPIDTLVDLLTEPTMELAPSLALAVMRALIFLRSPDVYNLLQIFLHKPVLQEICTLICGLDVSRA